MNLELIRAIFNAGYHAGYQAGMDNATSYERGSHQSQPKHGEVWWDINLTERLLPDSTWPFDVNKEKDWNSL